MMSRYLQLDKSKAGVREHLKARDELCYMELPTGWPYWFFVLIMNCLVGSLAGNSFGYARFIVPSESINMLLFLALSFCSFGMMTFLTSTVAHSLDTLSSHRNIYSVHCSDVIFF